uniref:Putative secreted protein n=1 Tax=Anopheles triannulatus TaxID=58253 RepID=A0A2M4B7U4_9DIPT
MTTTTSSALYAVRGFVLISVALPSGSRSSSNNSGWSGWVVLSPHHFTSFLASRIVTSSSTNGSETNILD